MTRVRLASAAEARSILEAEDDVTRALGSFDRSFRMRTKGPVTDEELRHFLATQTLDFTEAEAKAWESAIADVVRGADAIAGSLPAEVLVLKTTGREERGHAYTRGNAIVLPAPRVERLRGERAIYLIAHELFHVASRVSPALRDATYALLGFEKIAPLPPPPELDDRRLTNPDAYGFGHFLRLGERAVIPLLLSPLPLDAVFERATVLDFVKVSLLEIDPAAGSVVLDAAGRPVVLEATETDWSKRIGRNTAYTLHPEEVLADNHALLVRRSLGHEVSVADADFLASFEAALRACRPQLLTE